MKPSPFWVDEFPRPEGITSELPSEVDVLVVGSGLTGLSAALRLARGGKTVAVVDQGPIASGASSINGGMVSPDIKAGIKVIFDRFGPELGREMWQATVRSVEIVPEIARAENIDARIVRGGMAALGIHAKSRATFEASVAWYDKMVGVDWEVLGPDRLSEVVAGDHFTAVLFEPEGLGIQPARFVFGVAVAAASAGALLVDQCAVHDVSRDGPGFKVGTDKGAVRAGDVILATNGYTTSEPSPRIVATGGPDRLLHHRHRAVR